MKSSCLLPDRTFKSLKAEMSLLGFGFGFCFDTRFLSLNVIIPHPAVKWHWRVLTQIDAPADLVSFALTLSSVSSYPGPTPLHSFCICVWASFMHVFVKHLFSAKLCSKSTCPTGPIAYCIPDVFYPYLSFLVWSSSISAVFLVYRQLLSHRRRFELPLEILSKDRHRWWEWEVAKRAPPHTAACRRPSAPGEPVSLHISPLVTVLSRFSGPSPACSRFLFHRSTPICVLFLRLPFMPCCRSFSRTLSQSLRQISTDASGVPVTTPALSEQWQPVLSLGHYWMEGPNSHSLFSQGNLSYYSSWHSVLHQLVYKSESTNWNQPKREWTPSRMSLSGSPKTLYSAGIEPVTLCAWGQSSIPKPPFSFQTVSLWFLGQFSSLDLPRTWNLPGLDPMLLLMTGFWWYPYHPGLTPSCGWEQLPQTKPCPQALGSHCWPLLLP